MCSAHDRLSKETDNILLDLNEQCKHSTVFDNIFADRLTNDFTSHLQLNRYPFRSLSPSHSPRPPLPPHPRSVPRYRLLHRHRLMVFQTMLKRVKARTRGPKRELEDDFDLA